MGAKKIELVPMAVYYTNEQGVEDWTTVVGKTRKDGHCRYTLYSVRFGASLHDDSADQTRTFLARAQRWDPEHDCLWSVTHPDPLDDLDLDVAAV